MKAAFLDKLLEKLDKMDASSVQTQFLRLAHEKGIMETIFHAIQEGIVVLDAQQSISYANRAAEKLLGFTAEDVLGSTLDTYLRGIDWDLIEDFDEREWSRLVTREIEITYPEHRFLDFYIVPLNVVEEGESGTVVILRDVTRDRIQEKSTLESERLNALTLLAAGVAHEIGNPLNSLTIHLQLMERELAQLEDVETREVLGELTTVARQEVARLDGIINQFLKAVRPTQPAFEKVQLDEVLDKALLFLKSEIEDRDVWVERTVPDEVPAVQADPGQIRQAFFNIIRNAVQAMDEGGVLRISITAGDRFVAIRFEDNGTGISHEDLASIFEPYHTTKTQGSGLGLMVVQRIIREHGGEIEMQSVPGQGTTFTLLLPRDERRIRLLEAKESV